MVEPTNYELLGEAIVAQAGRDYIDVRKQIYLLGEDKKLLRELGKIMKFFNSGYYKLLTKVDSQWLISKLDEEFEAWKKQEELG